jgi:hypothetical protein
MDALTNKDFVPPGYELDLDNLRLYHSMIPFPIQRPPAYLTRGPVLIGAGGSDDCDLQQGNESSWKYTVADAGGGRDRLGGDIPEWYETGAEVSCFAYNILVVWNGVKCKIQYPTWKS